MSMIKQDIDAWLDQVDYKILNSADYMPSEFALTFMNFIKLVNGGVGESHKTPPVHLKMLDKVVSGRDYTANLCFRGSGKTTLFMEYFCLFVGVFHYLPNFGSVDGLIYVSDSMDNGVKSARKNIEFRYNNSEFCQQWIPHATFTDNYIEFGNREGQLLGIKLFGAKALALDTILYLASGGITTIRDCSVGDIIIGADGMPTLITEKSKVFHKPMYELTLDDGRTLKVSEDHWNQVWIKQFKSDRTFSSYSLTESTLSTLELLKQPLFAKDPNGSNRPLLWIQNIEPIQFPENTSLLLDPYTVGLLLGDGSMNRKASGNVPVVLTAHKDDWVTYAKEIPYELGKPYVDKRNSNAIYRTIIGINQFISAHGLSSHGNDKKIPDDFLFGSAAQRLALLQGLMDTDGSCSKDGKSSYSSNSKALVEGVMWLARSLGGEARWISTGKANHYRAFIRILQPLFRLERKLIRQKPFRNDKAAIVSITRIANEPSQCIAVNNQDRQFIAGEGLVRTHNTGLRGTKIFGKRPKIAILDDLVSDDDSNSLASMEKIKDTVYKGVNHALDPTKRKVIFNGTPFNKTDILVEAVESGAWDVNVWPVCEQFPCTEEEFSGAWPDRFSYAYIKEQYDMAEKTGKLSGFYQELMLRLTSEEERLVTDAEINWYQRKKLLANLGNFNFYITTDLANSEKKKSDNSVISVWAYNSNGDWFWVDGICERQTMDKNINDLFRLVQIYRPQQVGIEITGQQVAFIKWLQGEMINRNVWFNFASSDTSNTPGIRPMTSKLARFNIVVPWFKMGKMFFPEEMKQSKIIGQFMQELRLATFSGLKGKDDCIDTISMLGFLKPWKPSEALTHSVGDDGIWSLDDSSDYPSNLESYLV
jgi:phage terminase large subunit-like protein